jgi:sodium-dependent dicarboxylate transporter 2/3/5
VVLVPLPESVLKLDGAELTQQGRVVLGVLLFCLLLWIAEPIPFHIAGLVGMILLALLKAESFVNVVKLGFGNDTVLFFIGVLALSAAITKSGLGGASPC